MITLPPGTMVGAQPSAIREWEQLMRQIGTMVEQCLDAAQVVASTRPLPSVALARLRSCATRKSESRKSAMSISARATCSRKHSTIAGSEFSGNSPLQTH